MKINDITGYSDFSADSDRVEICFDLGTGQCYDFTLDEEEAADFTNLILNTPLKNTTNGPDVPGNNSAFAIYQGGKSYKFSIRGVYTENEKYSFCDNAVQDKIFEFAHNRGVFDTKVGIIYKVIDISDIVNLPTEKVFAENGDAVLQLLETNYGDCNYFFLHEDDEPSLPHIMGATEEFVYADYIRLSKGKLLVTYGIYQKYDRSSFYIAAPSAEEYDTGGGVTATYEFVWAYYRPPYQFEHTLILNIYS